VKGGAGKLNVPAYLEAFNRKLVDTKDLSNGGKIYRLQACVFDSSHGPGDSAIIQGRDGNLKYNCFHDSCTGRTWKEAQYQISGDASIDAWMLGQDTSGGEKQADALVRIGKGA